MSDRKKELILLVCLLALAFAVRAWLAGARWINPDEGAHLMDGILLLEGLVPELEFESRQLLYTQLTGAAVAILGTDLVQLRLFPVTVITLSGLVVHAIARNLWDWETGLMATALFLLLPFPLMMTVHTKTEPLAILAATGAVYCWIRSRSDWSPVLLVLSGVLVGVAFYIRQSTVVVLMVVLSSILVDRWGAWRRIGLSWGAVLLGLAAATSGVFLYYSRHAPDPGFLFETVSNPFSFVVGNLWSALGAVAGSGDAGALGRGDRLSFGRSLSNFLEAARVNVVLLVGAALTLAGAAYGALRRRGRRQSRTDLLLPAIWLVWLAVAYIFWTVMRGFFPAYFLEFLPPLSLLTAAGVMQFLRSLPGERSWRFHLLAAGILVLGMGGVHAALGTWQISRSLYFVVTVPVLGLIYLLDRSDRSGRHHGARWGGALAVTGLLAAVMVLVGPRLARMWSVPFYLAGAGAVVALVLWPSSHLARGSVKTVGSFIAYAVVLSGLFLSLSESGLLLDLRYDGVWSLETLEQTSRFLDETLSEDATVVSGAVIWTVQADRRPFADISHPLGLMAGVSDRQRQRVLNGMTDDPPDAIVLDGFTRRTFFDAFPEMARLLRSGYRMATTIEGTPYSVRIYLPSRASHPEAPGSKRNSHRD